MNSEIIEIQTLLEGKETEENWENKELGLGKLREILSDITINDIKPMLDDILINVNLFKLIGGM
jgi:hypothetical protein